MCLIWGYQSECESEGRELGGQSVGGPSLYIRQATEKETDTEKDGQTSQSPVLSLHGGRAVGRIRDMVPGPGLRAARGKKWEKLIGRDAHNSGRLPLIWSLSLKVETHMRPQLFNRPHSLNRIFSPSCCTTDWLRCKQNQTRAVSLGGTQLGLGQLGVS
ncbi:hypothetical protein BX600DRAFT_244422 [Xylariales sp. PMI_506]|nr:hypothetical protein BX600DRAFT_244422 [Xylariales sp. PMI_506]